MKTHKIILQISKGLIANLTDLTLYFTFLTLTSFGKTGGSKGVYKAFQETEILMNQINHKTILRCLQSLRQRKYIKPVYRKHKYEVTITREGMRKINHLFPVYNQKRVWDKHLYTVTYDIPTKNNKSRDMLRKILKQIGAAALQESVYLTPYNPKTILRQIINDYNIVGTILVADIGSDGSVGDEDLEVLINRIYKLDELNSRYNEFIGKFGKERKYFQHEGIFSYYSILKDDPQLPFDLLPPNWSGCKAHEIFAKLNSPIQ